MTNAEEMAMKTVHDLKGFKDAKCADVDCHSRTENGKKVLIDAALLPDKETAEKVHSLSGWAYKSNSQEQRATV